MKKVCISSKIAIAFFACTSLFQSCFKDTATKTYTIFKPVYKSAEEVRAGIKTDAPAAILKPGKIVVLGNYIFLNEVDKGVHIIDNTNPSAPVNKSFVAIPGNLDLAVKGSTLYADLYRDLVTIDISNPLAVAVKKITKNVFPPRQYPGFFIQDTARVVVDWIRKDTTVDAYEKPVSFPGGIFYDAQANLSSSSSAVVPSKIGVSGSMARFTLIHNHLYTVSDNSLNVFDISQSENPVFINQKALRWQLETIFAFKSNLFIGSQAGVYIFGTADPAQPNQLSVVPHLTICDPVIADDNFAYVTLHGGTVCHGTFNELDVLDISNITSPRNVKNYPLTNPHGLSKDGNTLFICDGAAGLKVFDAANVYNIKLLQTVDGITAYDVIALHNNAIVVTEDGLYQYDYTNNKQVTLRSKISYRL